MDYKCSILNNDGDDDDDDDFFQVTYELLIQTIEQHFSDIHPDNLDMELPGFRDLPRENFDDLVQFRLLKQ